MQFLHARDDARKPADVSKACSTSSSNKRGAAQLRIIYRIAGDAIGKQREAIGRFAWALLHLHRAGETGSTSLENPAPRLSHYIFGLRRDGLGITAEYENHGGAFSGRHGRYRLVTPIELVEIREPEGRS
jgi:hypothetical protein